MFDVEHDNSIKNGKRSMTLRSRIKNMNECKMQEMHHKIKQVQRTMKVVVIDLPT